MSNPLTNLNVKRIHELLELLSPAMAHELVIDDSEGVLKPKRLSLSNLAKLLVPYNGAQNDVDLGAHDIKTPNYTEALSLATLAEREYLAVALSKLAKVTSVVIAQLDGKSAYRGTLLASGYNLNDIDKTGTYTAPANAVNSPVFSEAVSEINYIMHINNDSATTSAVQLAIGATTSHIYLRNKIGTMWSAWSIGITPTEIGYLKSVTSNVQAQLNVLATNKQNISDKTNVWSEEPNDQRYPSEKLVKDSLDEQAGRLDTLEADELTEGSIAYDIEQSSDALKGVGYTEGSLKTHEDRLDTLEADDTTEGSVAKTVKDNAKDATYDNSTSELTADTLGGAIDELDGEIDTLEGRVDSTELTLARQGQDLASVKQTLQQGNGATLDFEDIGIVPLDARATGRANPTVEGMTARNLLGTKGDFETTGPMYVASYGSGTVGTLGINTTSPISGNRDTRLAVTTAGTSDIAPLLYNLNSNLPDLVVGHVYYLSFDYRVNSGTAILKQSFNGTSVVALNKTFTGSGRYGFLITCGGDNPNFGNLYWDGRNLFDIQWDNFSVVDLTSTFGTGNEPSEADCAKIFSYFDGTKSIQLPARVVSRGKNLFKTVQDVYRGADFYLYTMLDGRQCVRFTSGSAVKNYPIQFLPSTQYSVTLEYQTRIRQSGGGGENVFAFFYTDGTRSSISVAGNVNTTEWAKLTLTSTAGKTVESIGVYVIDYRTYVYVSEQGFQLEVSATPTTVEPYTDSTLYIADNEEVRSVPAIADEVKVVNGQLVKVQNVQRYVLQASDITALTARVNTKYARAILPAGFIGGTGVSNGRAIVIGWGLDVDFSDVDLDSSEGSIYITSTGLDFIVDTTTYATLAEAKAALAGTVIYYQLATPIITPLTTSGILQAKPNGTVYFEPYYEGSHQTNASSQITLPYTGTIDKLTGYDENLEPYDVPSTGYTLVGTLLTVTGAEENEVYYVELSRSEPLAPEMGVNTLNNMVVPTVVNASTYTVLEGDHTLLVNYTATGACTITIPTALILAYKRLVIKDSGGGAATKNITIGTQGTEKIDGADTYVINTAKGKVELASDGANMWVVG